MHTLKWPKTFTHLPPHPLFVLCFALSVTVRGVWLKETGVVKTSSESELLGSKLAGMCGNDKKSVLDPLGLGVCINSMDESSFSFEEDGEMMALRHTRSLPPLTPPLTPTTTPHRIHCDHITTITSTATTPTATPPPLLAPHPLINHTTASPHQPSSGVTIKFMGQPTECALLKFASDLGYDFKTLRSSVPGRSEKTKMADGKKFDYSSARKMVCTKKTKKNKFAVCVWREEKEKKKGGGGG
jgi:magnesium-transporting ATPase (P-type)